MSEIREYIETPKALSWSSISSYAECGEKWRLTRGHKVPQTTWYATLAGSAIHELTEFYDRALLDGLSHEEAEAATPPFKERFDELISKETREILPSGRVAKTITDAGGPNKKDYNWWLLKGPLFVRRWFAFRRVHPWQILVMPDGRPGIELDFDVKFAGQPVRGYIDRVFYDPEANAIIVVDLKAGAEPAGVLQLVTYALALDEVYGLRAEYGTFWRPAPQREEKGKPCPPDAGQLSQLTYMGDFDLMWMEDLYDQAARGIANGIFIPNVTAMCKGCTVREYCRAVAGEKAGEVPSLSIIADMLPLEDVSETEEIDGEPESQD